MTAYIDVDIYDTSVKAVIDTAAMVTLMNDSLFRRIFGERDCSSKCILHGIGNDPVTGHLIDNIPISIGQFTYTHRVCIAPIKEDCILGLDFLKEYDAVVDLARNNLLLHDQVIPLELTGDISAPVTVSVTRQVVIQPNTGGYIEVKLDGPMEGEFVVAPPPWKDCLFSSVYGTGSTVTLQVVNNTTNYVKFKKGAMIGIAEPAQSLHYCYHTEALDGGILDSDAELVLPEYLTDMYNFNCTDLTDSEKSQFKRLLVEFQTIFSKSDFDLGCLSGVEHKIITTDDFPVNEKFRRTPLVYQQQEKEYIDKLLEQGVIEPSCSEWSSAPVLVRKKTGELRYCIDYRALNDKTVKDKFNIPLIEDCLDSLQGKKLFSSLDLSSGFYQIPLEEASCDKTSFQTRYGTYRWTKLPMGLTNSPATFQRAMNLVLRGLTWEEVIVYHFCHVYRFPGDDRLS